MEKGEVEHVIHQKGVIWISLAIYNSKPRVRANNADLLNWHEVAKKLGIKVAVPEECTPIFLA